MTPADFSAFSVSFLLEKKQYAVIIPELDDL